MQVKTHCLKCDTEITLDFGDLTKEQALDLAERLDREPRECPGFHVELTGWRRLWQLDDAIHRAYDLGDTVTVEVPTDEEYIGQLLAEGKIIYDGATGRFPDLPSIHDVKGLTHLGHGCFATVEYTFVRRDSPRGARLYERIEG